MTSRPLQVPLLLPTILFVLGCLVFGAFDIGLWIPLAILMVSGVLFLWRGWGVALLIVAFAVGGVRVVLYDGEEHEGHKYESWEESSSIREVALERVGALELSPRADGLLRAMVLGERGSIEPRQWRQYSRSGASHILAVSGLHMSIIFLFLNFLLLPVVLLPRGHTLRNVLIVGVVWWYASIVGFTPSVVRSAAMFSVLQIAWVWGRPYSGVNALLFAVLVGVAITPSIIYSVGFQLSVVAVAAIFLWAQPLYYRVFGGGGFWISALCVSLSCSVAVMPIVSYTFGITPLLGVLYSPLFILCATLIVFCGALWILFPVAIFAPIIRLIVEISAMLQDRGVEWVATKSWGVIDYRAAEVEVILIYLIYIVITLLAWSKKDEN